MLSIGHNILAESELPRGFPCYGRRVLLKQLVGPVFGCILFVYKQSRRALEVGEAIRVDSSRYNDYCCAGMPRPAKAGSGQKRASESLEEDAFVSLQLTADVLVRKVEKVLRSADISPTQYNVLRILRGSPDGLPCREIADRMISRDPDVTRLLDRLEKRGLILRRRETKDRRIVLARITPEGLRLLGGLDTPVLDTHRRQLGHLGRDRLRRLVEMLEVARQKAG